MSSILLRGLAAATVVTAFAACTSQSGAVAQPPPTPVAAAPTSAPAPSPAPAATAARRDPDPGWPRTTVDRSGWRVTAYQPQIERWVGDELRARVATVAAAPDGAPVYVWVTVRARTSVDKRPRLVALDDVEVDRMIPATAPPHPEELEAALRASLPALLSPIALDRFVVELAAEGARAADHVQTVRNEPPRIVVSSTMSVLVPVDGEPVWRRASDRYDRLMNTRALLLLERSRRWMYLYVADTWYRARALHGEWRTAPLLPPGLDEIRARLAASGSVDLLDAPGSPLARALYVGRVPRIFVATAPTALVQLDGPPRLEPIDDTRLSSVENSDRDLFRDAADGRFYVLLSGRWFRAGSLDGPWQYVEPAELPRDFARIPPEHPRARVLAAVPGTVLAAEALVENEVPETATVRVADAKLEVDYDGPPRFAPLEGTLLRWAVNTATPVVEVSAPVGGNGLYYALADGLWFTARAPVGPWRVATTVPGALYDIPARSPLHFVSYVRVYGASGDRVRVGYTPGYFGSVLTPSGVVVFGTGWDHPPWVGTRFVGRPATYGFDARWEPGLGWTLGGDVGSARATFRPWWQPTLDAVAAADAATFAAQRVDLYARWSDAIAPRAERLAAAVDVGPGGDDLYAAADGRIYRAQGAAWERRSAEGWQPVTAASLQATAGAGATRDELRVLERVRQARRDAQLRWELFRETSTLAP